MKRTDEDEFGSDVSTGVEAVVVGHLPTRAGPWVAQYARALSEHLGEAVGLVRLGADRLSLDVIGMGLDDGSLGDAGSFAEAVASVGDRVAAWLVSASDLGEPELCLDPRVSRVTLLCTNEDSGVLATYRTIRQLMAWDRRPRSIAVSGLGVDAVGAESLWTRLREATSTLLDGDLEMAAFVERMGPTGAAPVFWTDTPDSVDAVLGAIERSTRGDDGAGAGGSHRERASAGVGGAEAEVEGDRGVGLKLVGPGAEGRGAMGGSGVGSGSGPGAALDGTVGAARAAGERASGGARSVAGSGGSGGAGESVVGLIGGLRSADVSCAVDAGVEVALDGSGRVALVLVDDAERGAYRLYAAARWARAHAELIRRSCGAVLGERVDGGDAVSLHLVVRGGLGIERALALDWNVYVLIERDGGAGVRVRVLEPVRV
ncbi:MAG: hypothetical protein ACTS3F_03865 [Phycisphaerales bacterium]